MSNLLVINSSAAGQASVSRGLVGALVSQIAAQDPAVTVTERDLGASPVPHLNGDTLAGFGQPETPAQIASRELSDALVAEVFAADTLVIGAPMYNFGITSTLKSWFDHILRAGVTFNYTETGPVGLLSGRKVIVVLSRGGIYGEGAAQVMDAQEPHLRAMLGFVGLTDVTFVRAEGLSMGPDPRAAGIAKAEAHVVSLSPVFAKAA
ncbi:FMN-dependent NADH-azoreductase [soil metagenome]